MTFASTVLAIAVGALPTAPVSEDQNDLPAIAWNDNTAAAGVRAGQSLTLDGIAKGYIVDAIAATLERAGVRNYCIDAGGDIRTGGTKEHGRPWQVAVRDPDGLDLVNQYPGDIRWMFTEISNKTPAAADIIRRDLYRMIADNLTPLEAAQDLQTGLGEWYEPAQSCK